MKYEELSESDKEKAREWLCALTFGDSSDWQPIYEQAAEAAALLGITIDSRSFKTIGNGTGSEPAIFFSGFSSQGDGACFEGSYHYMPGAVKAVAKEWPEDKELQRIAKALQGAQRKHFYKLEATCKHRGHYYHSGCMQVEVEHREDMYRDIGDAETDVTDALRSFADWIYDQLEAEHDYMTSDEQLEETILANDYDFDVGNGGIRL